MAPVFIFAEQVRKILQSGEKKIDVPEGARISAAAYELIRDNNIRITYVTDQIVTANAEITEEGEKPLDIADSRAARDKPATEEIKNDPTQKAAGDISEEELEDIVERVIRRFKKLKGLKPEEKTDEEYLRVTKETEATADSDLVICRCEEITKAEIKEAIRNGMRTLNGIKRVTRAGMGLCQGQTCQRLVTRLLSDELGLSPADVDPTTARGPVRPLRLEVFANS